MIIEKFSTLAKRETHIDWIVENLLSSGGFTYLVGEAGSGKSILCIQLVDAIQQGKPFLNMPCKKRNCLYIQVDTGRLEWQAQVKNVAPNGFAWTMYSMADLFLDKPTEVESVRQIIWGTYPISTVKNSPSQVLQHIPFDLIVFDVLNKMTRQDINTKPAMNYVLEKLEYMCVQGEGEEKESKHFILVHHPSKGKKRGVDAGSGYAGFGGLCNNMLTLGNELLVLEKSKVIGKREILMQQSKSTGMWSLPGDTLDNSQPESIRDIEEALGIKLS